MKKIMMLVAVALLGSSQAFAGFMVEPYFGYIVSGESKSTTATSDVSGTALGARLGYSMRGLMFGVDYMMSNLTVEPATGSDVDSKATDMGVFVGYEFPIMFRVYASYFFSSKAEAETTPAVEYSGNGTRIGIGYTGLPFIAINLEMISQSYDEATIGGFTGTTNLDVDATALVISLPLP